MGGGVWVHVWGCGEVRGHGGVWGRLLGEEKSKKEKSQNSKRTFPIMSYSTVIRGEM